MPQSPTGKRMLKRISPIYDNSIFMKCFVEGVGEEYDKIRTYFETLRDQSHTSTVTWAIEAQEHRYSIVPDDSLTLEQRRARLKIKLQAKRPLNPAILEKYAKDNYGIDIYLDEQSKPGIISITLEDYSKAAKFIKWLLIEKPAHLDILVTIYKCVKFPLYVGIGQYRRGRISIGSLETVTRDADKIIDRLGDRTYIIERTKVTIIDDDGTSVIPIAQFYPLFAGVGQFRRGRISISSLETVTLAPQQITDALGNRTYIISPTQVTVIDGNDTSIIPIAPKSSDELILNLAFPTGGQRTVTLSNPRIDLTAEEVNAVADFAIDRELLLNTDEVTADLLNKAQLVTITEEELDLSLYFPQGDDSIG